MRITRSLDEELQLLQGKHAKEILSFLKAYKKEFTKFDKISTKGELIDAILKSDIVLNGDYHTLSQSQRIPIRILREVIKKRPQIVLATEVIMMKHQRHLDDFMEGRTSEEQFLDRIDYNNTWGFDWKNFRPWFDFAKQNNIKMVGLNTGKTGVSLQDRDRRAAELIVGLTMLYPKHLIYSIFGDLHMARNRLPGEVTKLLQNYKLKRKMLTIFENSETIYWLLAKRDQEEKVDVVKVRSDAYCVMNVPPWVRLQSQINWMEQNAELQITEEPGWEESEEDIYIDCSDQVYSYIQTIANYFNLPSKDLDNFSVHTMDDFSFIQRLERSKKYSKAGIRYLLSLIEESSSFFIPRENIIYLSGLSINGVAEEATKYIYSISSKFKGYGRDPATTFFQSVYLEVLGFFGSKLINHKRKCAQMRDFKIFLKKSAHSKSKIIKEKRLIAKGVIFYKEREKNVESGKAFNTQLPQFIKSKPRLYFAVSKAIGAMIGEKLYQAMMDGVVNIEWLKSLFFAKIDTKEGAIKQIEQIIRIVKDVKVSYRGKIDHL